MRTVVVGNRELAKHVLTFLLDREWHVVGAVAPTGQSARRQAGYVPFDDVAERHGIELVETTDINDEATREALAALDPDLCICPGWHQIIDESVLDVPAQSFVGFHASDLPRGRGGAPVNWSLIHGSSQVTISLFYYSTGVDAGDVIHKERVDIAARDDVDTVLDRLAVAACDALAATREAFESGDADGTPQAVEDATYRPRRQPQDGVIDWSQSASQLRDWIRAQTDPYPGEFTFRDGDRLRVWATETTGRSADGTSPGTVVSVVPGEGLDVATGDGVLRLTRIQLEGRPRLWADEFARRHDLKAGDSFGRDHRPSSWRYTGIRDLTGGTDFSGPTNLAPGETGEILAVVESETPRSVDVTATLEGDTIVETSLAVDGRETVPITYRVESAGTHSLRVAFAEDGNRIDTRYLKVFVVG